MVPLPLPTAWDCGTVSLSEFLSQEGVVDARILNFPFPPGSSLDRGRSPGLGNWPPGWAPAGSCWSAAVRSARRSGLLDRVEQSLTQAGLTCRVFAGIHPNPACFQVREGVQAALEFGADSDPCRRRGSVIDAAKAIALGAAGAGG